MSLVTYKGKVYQQVDGPRMRSAAELFDLQGKATKKLRELDDELLHEMIEAGEYLRAELSAKEMELVNMRGYNETLEQKNANYADQVESLEGRLLTSERHRKHYEEQCSQHIKDHRKTSEALHFMRMERDKLSNRINRITEQNLKQYEEIRRLNKMLEKLQPKTKKHK